MDHTYNLKSLEFHKTEKENIFKNFNTFKLIDENCQPILKLLNFNQNDYFVSDLSRNSFKVFKNDEPLKIEIISFDDFTIMNVRYDVYSNDSSIFNIYSEAIFKRLEQLIPNILDFKAIPLKRFKDQETLIHNSKFDYLCKYNIKFQFKRTCNDESLNIFFLSLILLHLKEFNHFITVDKMKKILKLEAFKINKLDFWDNVSFNSLMYDYDKHYQIFQNFKSIGLFNSDEFGNFKKESIDLYNINFRY